MNTIDIESAIRAAGESRASSLKLRNRGITSLPPQLGELEHLQELDLSGNHLAALPESIGGLVSLKYLALRDNELLTLPAAIGNLAYLQDLALEGNRLETLPSEFADLITLEFLSLKRNRLTIFPPEICRLTNLQWLDLANNQLASLAEGIGRLRSLVNLDVSNNFLRELTPAVGKLAHLRSLSLDGNHLTTLPDQVGDLADLLSLGVVGNRIASVPRAIARLVALQHLHLSANVITELPAWLGDFRELVSLDVSQNQIAALPPALFSIPTLKTLIAGGNRIATLSTELARLAELEDFDLRNNLLRALPPEIGKLSALKRLDLSHNDIERLPEEIVNLGALEYLSLDRNRLTTLPPDISKLTSLRRLGLSGNAFRALPKALGELKSLARLDVRGNPLPGPPELLRDPGAVEAIVKVITELEDEPPAHLDEAKLLVLGDPSVGKSSVIERLRCGTFTKHPTTLGIEIHDELAIHGWTVEDQRGNITVNVWDFGGQEIQHSTHQFFLTTRSLYLLVLDARRGDQLSSLMYWLTMIRSFGGDSPIVIVVNQSDQLKGQRALNVDRFALQRSFHIRAFVETSCATGEGIAELKREIATEIGRLAHVRDRVPPKWLRVKQRLKDERRSYLSFDAFRAICEEEGVCDDASCDRLARLLNDLGSVVLLSDDTHILDPRWVTRGVYAVLTDDTVVKNKGMFRSTDLGAIFDARAETRGLYPAPTHTRLVNIMRQFELCLKFGPGGRFLIPRHLDDREPERGWTGLSCLGFFYRYELLPDSIISRFIVKMSARLDGYWKSGAYVRDRDNRARVVADPGRREISIAVEGKPQTRRALLAVIRSVLEDINAGYPALEVTAFVPLPDEPSVAVPYDELIAREDSRRQTIFVAKMKRDYDVGTLLDGVDDRRGTVAGDKSNAPVKHALDADPIRVFISYSSTDTLLEDELEAHLAPLWREGVIICWSDRSIRPGEAWKERILEELERAEIVLLLVSSNFLASDYCMDEELKTALVNHAANRTKVVPIIARDVAWKGTSFGHLQALPKKWASVSSAPSPDAGWSTVCEAIGVLARELRAARRSTGDSV